MLHPVLDGLFDYYLAHQDELVKEYNGKVIVLVDNKVVACHDTYGDAHQSAIEMYQPGTFLLQKCSPGPGDHTIRIRSPFRVHFDDANA